jgi:hypothetical protein
MNSIERVLPSGLVFFLTFGRLAYRVSFLLVFRQLEKANGPVTGITGPLRLRTRPLYLPQLAGPRLSGYRAVLGPPGQASRQQVFR